MQSRIKHLKPGERALIQPLILSSGGKRRGGEGRLGGKRGGKAKKNH